MANNNELEEFEFRARAEREAGQQTEPTPGTMSAPAIAYGGTDSPSVFKQALGGAKHAWDRAAAGLQGMAGAAGLPTGESLQPLVKQGKAFVKETGPASSVGQFAGDAALTAPVAAALPATLLPQFIGNAAWNAAISPEARGEAAALGGLGGALPSAAKGALQLSGNALKHALGLTTGAGAESVGQAFRNAPGFVENLRGNVPAASVVEQARSGVQQLRQSMYDAYATAKGGWASDTTPLDFKPIGRAYNDAVAKFSFKGTPQPGIEGVQQQTKAVFEDWLSKARTDPSYLTVEGLDALKRHLATITPSDVTNRTGRAFVSEVTDAVKKSIIQQKPEYAAAMKNYFNASDQLDEIARTLSLGDKATTDTALRKLQSLTRNNAQANFGQRVELAGQLPTDVLPAVAGQAMNSWTPRGLQSAVASGTGVGSLLLNPWGAATLPLFSPRAVGEATRGAGMVTQDPRTQAVLEALRRMTPAVTRGQGNE